MSLDETLNNLNETLGKVASLLQTVEYAILIVAVAFSILMIGCVGHFYYRTYKKYKKLPHEETDTSSYTKSKYHHTNLDV